MKDKVIGIVFLILIGIILVQYFTWNPPTDYTEYIKIGGKEYVLLSMDKDTVWVDETITKTNYVPIKGDKIIVEVPAEIDTLAILQDYYAKYAYSDTVLLDSIGTVQINDTISKNKIISRSLIFNYKIPLITETITVKEKPTNQLYLGGGVNFDKTDFLNSAYVGAILKTKKDKIFVLNAGVSTATTTVKPYVGLGLYWKLKRN